MARVGVTFEGNSAGAVKAAKQAANALKDVKKTAAETAQSNVSKRVEERRSLEAMAAEYRKLAGAAKRGSEEQVAAVKEEQAALRKLSSEHGVHSRHLKTGTDDMGKFTRGALAGSGVLSHFGRSIAFASSAFLGAAGFTAVVRQSISAASDLHEQINKSDVVFGTSAGAVKEWSKDSATAMGIARSEALAMAGTFGNMLVPMGFARSEAAKMSTGLVQLSSDMASFNNADPSEVLRALQSGLAGQVRPLREFGVFLDQARIKAVALADGIVTPTVETRKLSQAQQAYAIAQDKATEAIAKHGPKSREAAAAELTLQKSADAVSKAMAGHVPTLTAAQKAMATYKIILKDTHDAQGDFARTSDGLANQTRILKAQLTNLEEELGSALLPTITKYLPLVTSWIDKNEKNGTFQRDFNQAVKIAGDVVQGVIPVIKTMVGLFKTFADNVGGTKNALLIIGGVMVGTKVLGAVKTLSGSIGEAAANARSLVKWLKELHTIKLPGPMNLPLTIGGLTIAVAAADVAAIFAASGSNPNVPSTAGATGHAGVVAGLAKANLIPSSAAVAAGKAAGIASDTPFGKAMQDPKFVAYLYKWAVAHGLVTTGGAAGGAGSEAGAKAAAGKGHGAPAATDVPGGTVTQIARAAAASPDAHATSFHLEGERTPYDCSAFVQAVFRKAGLGDVGSTTYTQFAHGRKVEKNDLQADDVVFFNYPGEKSPGHVGIYVGGGYMVHDHGASRGVDYQPVDWSAYVGARCFIPAHIHGAEAPTTATDPAPAGGRKFTEKPKPGPTRLEVLDTAVSRAKALTPKNTADDLKALRAERDYIKQRIKEGHATKDLYDQLASLNSEIDSITTGKKVKVTRGTGLLTAPTRIAIAQARTPVERRGALVQARDELEKLQKTAAKSERVPIAEELGQINKQIRAIDVAAAKKKAEEIAKANERVAERIKKATEKARAAWEKHVKDLQRIAAEAQRTFETQWGKMADRTLSAFDDATKQVLKGLQDDFKRVMDAFDDETTGHLKSMQKAFAQQMKDFDKETSDHLKDMAKDAQRQLDDFDRETQRGLNALDAPDQTPEEQALASFDARRALEDHNQKLIDLQKALNDAINAGDPEQIQQAQQAINQQMLDDQRAALQLQADESRKAADKKAQDAKDAYQTERDDQRTALGDILTDQQTAYQDQRTALGTALGDAEQDLEDAYTKQRDTIATGMSDAEQAIEDGYTKQRDTERQALQDWLEDQRTALENGTTQWNTFFQTLVGLAGSYGVDVGAAFQAGWASVADPAATMLGAAAAVTAAQQHPGVPTGRPQGVTFGGTAGPYIGTLPGFASGGWSDSRPTSIDPRDTILARLRPGEYVMSPEEVAAGRPRWSASGDTYELHFHGPVFDTRREIEDAVAAFAQPGLVRRGPSIVMGR